MNRLDRIKAKKLQNSPANQGGGSTPIGDVPKYMSGGITPLTETIDDTEYAFIKEMKDIELEKEYFLEEIVHHPKLFEQFPLIRKTIVIFDNINNEEQHANSQANPKDGIIIIRLHFNHYKKYKHEKYELRTTDSPEFSKEAVMLHEIQHVLQFTFGRMRGYGYAIAEQVALAENACIDKADAARKGLAVKVADDAHLLYVAQSIEQDAMWTVDQWLKKINLRYAHRKDLFFDYANILKFLREGNTHVLDYFTSPSINLGKGRLRKLGGELSKTSPLHRIEDAEKKISDAIIKVKTPRREYTLEVGGITANEAIEKVKEEYPKFKEFEYKTITYKRTGKKGEFIKRIDPPEKIEQRWQKKKDHIRELSDNVSRLKNRITRDLKSEDEKDCLTALVVAIMLKTGERVGNDKSAEYKKKSKKDKRKKAYGVTGFKREHVEVVGNKIHLNYIGKKGVPQEKSFSDEKLAKALKNAIKNCKGEFIFETTDYNITDNHVNNYLKEFNISAKAVRGYSANKWVLDKLITTKPEETDKKRKKQLGIILKNVAAKVGHGPSVLKNQYLMPEVITYWVDKGEVFDIKEAGYVMEKGGEINNNLIKENKDEIGNVIRGTCEATRGAAIQTTARYPRGSEETNEMAQRGEPSQEQGRGDRTIGKRRISKNIIKKETGGETPENEDFNNLKNITKDEISEIISGTRTVRDGTAIQAASSYLRRSKGSIPASGSENFKRQDEGALREYISKNNLWLPLPNQKNKLGAGGESTVYFQDGGIIKLNNGRLYYSWEAYFNSLLINNLLFPATSYELIGFTEENGRLFSVTKQSFIKETHPTNLIEARKVLSDLGFTYIRNNHYSNPTLGVELKDLHVGNVLTKDDVPYFIDTIFYLQEELSTMGKGGKIPNNNFKNITKDGIDNIISGKSEVSNGKSIHSIANYLKRSTGASSSYSNPKFFKQHEEGILRNYGKLLSISDLGIYFSEGTEHRVYLHDDKTVIKLNSGYFYNSWADYFNSLLLNNYFFPDTAYDLLGFAEENGKLFSVVKQSFIRSNEQINLGLVKKFLASNGFQNTRNDDYENKEIGVILEDLHAQNVISNNGILYFIDTVFFLKKDVDKKGTGGEVSGYYSFKNQFGSFTSVKVMPLDENLRTSTDFFTAEIKVRRKEGENIAIQTKYKTFPISEYEPYVKDLKERGAEEKELGGELYNKNNELKFTKLFNNLFVVNSDTQEKLAKTFIRPNQYLDSDKFKGKIFSLDEIKDAFIKDKGSFTYYRDFKGFNVPDSVTDKFLSGNFNPLGEEEKWLFENLKANITERPYYVIGYVDVDGEESTRHHELAHALYYLNPAYKNEVNDVVDKFWKNISDESTNKVQKFLTKLGYDKSIWSDEMNAYLIADKKYLISQLAWDDEFEPYRNKLNKIFEVHYYRTFNESFSDLPRVGTEKMESGGITSEDIISRYNLTGKTSVPIRFKGDNKTYFTKKLSLDRKFIFVLDCSGKSHGKKITDIVHINGRDIVLEKGGYVNKKSTSHHESRIPTNKNYDMNNKNMEKGGTIPQRYKDMGFSRVGQKKKSMRPEKKWMVLAKKGDKYKVVHGGQKGMKDFSQHRDKKRQRRFWDRMGGFDSEKSKDPFSPLYWHKRFGTWEKGGVLEDGTIKVAWVDSETPDIMESKMFDSVEDALSYSEGKTFLIFELEDAHDDYYKWSLLPHGMYSKYKMALEWSKLARGGEIETIVTSDGSQGGIFKGDSHADSPVGGMPTIVNGTGQKILVEGNEALLVPKVATLSRKIRIIGSPKAVLSKINELGDGANFSEEEAKLEILKKGGKMKKRIRHISGKTVTADAGAMVVNKKNTQADITLDCSGIPVGIASRVNELGGHGVKFSDEEGSCKILNKNEIKHKMKTGKSRLDNVRERGGKANVAETPKVEPSKEDTRISEMVNDFKQKGVAYSRIDNDDSGFPDKAGTTWERIGITSQTGMDIIYFDTNIYKSGHDALRGLKKKKGGSMKAGGEMKEEEKKYKRIHFSNKDMGKLLSAHQHFFKDDDWEFQNAPDNYIQYRNVIKGGIKPIIVGRWIEVKKVGDELVGTLIIIDDSPESPLVKWLVKNRYMTKEESYKISNGGSMEVGGVSDNSKQIYWTLPHITPVHNQAGINIVIEKQGAQVKHPHGQYQLYKVYMESPDGEKYWIKTGLSDDAARKRAEELKYTIEAGYKVAEQIQRQYSKIK